jgi:molybdopterin synthase sulfur carrier subunit
VSVEIRIPTVLRRFTDGTAQVEVDPGTLRDVIDQLDARYRGLRNQLLSEDGELRQFVNVYVNDEDARYLDRLDTKVSEGDTISLLPSVAGGGAVSPA